MREGPRRLHGQGFATRLQSPNFNARAGSTPASAGDASRVRGSPRARPRRRPPRDGKGRVAPQNSARHRPVCFRHSSASLRRPLRPCARERARAFRSAALRSVAFAADGPCRCCPSRRLRSGERRPLEVKYRGRARGCEEKLFWKRAPGVPQNSRGARPSGRVEIVGARVELFLPVARRRGMLGA
jgi:hypothetical protein